MTNFKRPYLALNVTDFWRRWHISLSTWFRDYVYIPLGGNRCSPARNYFNLFITFLISGIWHGANWTFVIWGSLNGLYQIIGKFFIPVKTKFSSFFNKKILVIYDLVVTFLLICFSWIFFRANNVYEAYIIINKILRFDPGFFIGSKSSFVYGLFAVIILIVSDVLQELNSGRNFFLENNIKVIRYFSYLFFTILILMIGVFDSSQFIYFQF